jgi:leucyl/phenylalanyl-tRNA--protein transferase
MQKAYIKLHEMGFARSVEVWQNKQLVGGLYGIYLKEKRIFCGESMFSKTVMPRNTGLSVWSKN